MPLGGCHHDSTFQQRGLCVRYPVRMKEDLLPLEHFQGERLVGQLMTTMGWIRRLPPCCP